MKKRLLSGLLAVILLLSALPVAAAADSGIAYASTQSILLNGETVELQAYALKEANGYYTNYVKVRDIAWLLNGTEAQFDLSWDGAVNFVTGMTYTPNGSEMITPYSGDQSYQISTAATKVNGTVADLKAITITYNGGGYTYYKLRDLGDALNFTVEWDADLGIVVDVPPAEPREEVLIRGDEYVFPVTDGRISGDTVLSQFPSAAYYATNSSYKTADAKRLSMVPDAEAAKFYETVFYKFYYNMCIADPGTIQNGGKGVKLTADSKIQVQSSTPEQWEMWCYLFDEDLNCIAQLKSVDESGAAFVLSDYNAGEFLNTFSAELDAATARLRRDSLQYIAVEGDDRWKVVTNTAGHNIGDLYHGSLSVYRTGATEDQLVQWVLAIAHLEMHYLPNRVITTASGLENAHFNTATAQIRPLTWIDGYSDEYGFDCGCGSSSQNTTVHYFYTRSGDFVSYGVFGS